MTLIAVVACSSETVEWIENRRRHRSDDFFDGGANDYPRLNFPRFNSWLPSTWAIGIIRIEAALHGIGIVRRRRKSGDIDTLFELAAYHPFETALAITALNSSKPLTVALTKPSRLTPTQQRAVVAELAQQIPSLRSTIDDFGEWIEHQQIPADLRYRLAEQKDQARLAFAVANIDPQVLNRWQYRPGIDNYFESLPAEPSESSREAPTESVEERDVDEDFLIHHDLDVVQGWARGHDIGTKRRFFSPDRSQELVLYYANTNGVEEETGADLVYYHPQRRALVFVQYKKMKRERGSTQRRYRPDGQLDLELDRMADVSEACRILAPRSENANGYRLNADPCFIKLCDPAIENLRPSAPVGGWILPVSYFQQLRGTPAATGPNGGEVFTTDSFDRHLNTTIFIELIKGGWVGSRGAATQHLFKVVDRLCSRRDRGLTVAIHRG